MLAGGVGGEPSARFRLADASRVLRRYPGAALVMGGFVAQIFVRGLLITLIVVASIELLRHGRHRGRAAERGDRPGRSRRCDSVRSGSSASGD